MTALNPKSQGETCDNCKHDYNPRSSDSPTDRRSAACHCALKMLTDYVPLCYRSLFDVKPPFQTQGKRLSAKCGKTVCLTSRIPLRLKHETSSLLSAKTWRWHTIFASWEQVHPAMQMWMRVTAVCQKNQGEWQIRHASSLSSI